MTAPEESTARPPEAEEEQQQDDMEEDEWIVSCRCESARAVSTLLSCLKSVGGGKTAASERLDATQSERRSSSTSHHLQPVTVFCSPSSLTFHTAARAKQMQASVDMQASLFSEYRVAGGSDDGDGGEDWQAGGEFCVNLTTVLECLAVMGNHSDNVKLTFSYNATQEIFKLELLEPVSGCLSTAVIPGMTTAAEEHTASSQLALAFRSSPIAARIIVKSETLKDVLAELEAVTGATTVSVALSPQGLDMATTGHWGECLVTVPGRGHHVVSLEVLNNSNDAAVQQHPSRSYPFTSLVESMRGLDIAEETCITINHGTNRSPWYNFGTSNVVFCFL
jgi:hypothetical protein